MSESWFNWGGWEKKVDNKYILIFILGAFLLVILVKLGGGGFMGGGKTIIIYKGSKGRRVRGKRNAPSKHPEGKFQFYITQQKRGTMK